jgi:hypothetical protein
VAVEAVQLAALAELVVMAAVLLVVPLGQLVEMELLTLVAVEAVVAEA